MEIEMPVIGLHAIGQNLVDLVVGLEAKNKI
jgi:hypothetical protein